MNMENFYAALVKHGGLDDEEIAMVPTVFKEQHINFRILSRLTEAELQADGIVQGGLRKSILAVLGK